MIPSKLDPLLCDPDSLFEKAVTLLDEGIPSHATSRTDVASAICRAYQLLAPDIAAIDRLRESNSTISYPDLFAVQRHEKTAALLYFVRHLLLDTASSAPAVREIVEAQRDLSLFIEALYRLEAFDAFVLLYDFAAAQPREADTAFWPKVCFRALQLMAMLPAYRPNLLEFLKDRPEVRRNVEMLMTVSDAGIAELFQSVGEDYLRARKSGELGRQTLASSPYVGCYQMYDQGPRDTQCAGLAALLLAQGRIARAVEHAQQPILLSWVLEGSDLAASAVFSATRNALPALQYANLLEQVLTRVDLSPVRLAAAVLEVGSINLTLSPNGGELKLNKLLVAIALTDEPVLTGVARLAVRELGAVNGFNEALHILEEAPVIVVAEEALAVLRDLRRLTLAEAPVRRRASLQPAYQAARTQLQQIDSLADAAWSCTSEEMAAIYMERLKALNARPELERLSQRNNRISELAKKTLSELRLLSSHLRQR